VFVSSGSVYAEPYFPGYDESAPTVELEDPASEEVLRDYGALKAACEEVVRELFPESHTNVRAGLLVGPHDGSGRFTYWPVRGALGGEVLAPGIPERLTQFIDVRDIGAWMVDAGERGLSGTFNVTGKPMPLGAVLEACGISEPVWIDESFLLEQGVGPWMELPLWVPAEANPFLQMDVETAIAAGLSFRPLEETVRDTLAWAQSEGAGLVTETPYGTAGLDAAREAELLDAWRSHSRAGV
jgi:2'-hydroxyisoflavone reductase